MLSFLLVVLPQFIDLILGFKNNCDFIFIFVREQKVVNCLLFGFATYYTYPTSSFLFVSVFFQVRKLLSKIPLMSKIVVIKKHGF